MKMANMLKYLCSHFLVHSMNFDLFDQVTKAVNELNPNRILQISMDGPSLNFKFLQKVQDNRKANEQPLLVDTVAVDYTPFTALLKLVCRAMIGC